MLGLAPFGPVVHVFELAMLNGSTFRAGAILMAVVDAKRFAPDAPLVIVKSQQPADEADQVHARQDRRLASATSRGVYPAMLTVFRVQSGKPDIPGTVNCAMASPGTEDPAFAALRVAAELARYPQPLRGLYVMRPAGEAWGNVDPSKVLAAGGIRVPAAEQWWDAFFMGLLSRAMPLRAIIMDDEGPFEDFAGLGVWDVIGKPDHARELFADKNFHRVAPKVVRQYGAERYAGLSLGNPADAVPYAAWHDWIRSWRNDLFRACVVRPYRKYFAGVDTVIGHYGDVSNRVFDLNGWPQPVGTVDGVAMPDCYPDWRGILANANPMGPDWGGLVQAHNVLRSSQLKPAIPYLSYATWDNDQDEHTARRALAIWKNRMLWRSAFRMYSEIIYWENPALDPQADAVMAEEIDRANREVARRDKTFPAVPVDAECIVTMDHGFSATGLRLPG